MLALPTWSCKARRRRKRRRHRSVTSGRVTSKEKEVRAERGGLQRALVALLLVGQPEQDVFAHGRVVDECRLRHVRHLHQAGRPRVKAAANSPDYVARL